MSVPYVCPRKAAGTQTGYELRFGGTTAEPPAELLRASSPPSPRASPEFEFIGHGPEHQKVMYDLELQLLRERQKSPRRSPRQFYSRTPSATSVRDSGVGTDPPQSVQKDVPDADLGPSPPAEANKVEGLKRSLDGALNEIASLHARIATLEAESRPVLMLEPRPITPPPPLQPPEQAAFELVLRTDPERQRVAAEVEERLSRHRRRTSTSPNESYDSQSPISRPSAGPPSERSPLRLPPCPTLPSITNGGKPTRPAQAERSSQALTLRANTQGSQHTGTLASVAVRSPRIAAPPRNYRYQEEEQELLWREISALEVLVGDLVHWKHVYLQFLDPQDGTGWGVQELGLWVEHSGIQGVTYEELRTMITQVDVRRRGRLTFWEFLAVQLYFRLRLDRQPSPGGAVVPLRALAAFCAQSCFD